MKRYYFLLCLIGCCVFSGAANAALSPSQCEKELSSPRSVILRSFQTIENHFSSMIWQYKKYRELVYGPLWDSEMMARDDYSAARRAKGEVLVERYRFNAENILKRAESSQDSIFEKVEEIKAQAIVFDQSCSAWGFQDCFEIWRDEFRDRVRALEFFLREHVDLEHVWAEEIEETEGENPSEHHDFGARYADYFTKWEVDVYPKFFSLLRDAREYIEYKWVGQKCCLFCEEGAAYHAQNSIKRALVADPEATLGVDGDVVGKAGLVEAFNEMENS